MVTMIMHDKDMVLHTGTISEGLAARQERRVKEIMHRDKCTFAEAYNKLIEESHAITRNHGQGGGPRS